jgi:hypothetical protein
MKKMSAIVVIFLITFSAFSILAPKVKADDQLGSSSPPAGYTPKVPDEINGSATALLIEDVLPWAYDSDALALNQLGISYDLTHSSNIQNVNLAEYKFIILASDQPTSTYVNIAKNIAQIDSYVSDGGVYVAHACDEAWSNGDWSGLQIMPGGVTHVTRYYTMYIHITDPQSPIVASLNDAYFAGWGYSAHGYFTNVPAGADTVMVTETNLGSGVPDLNKPTYIIYSYGSGKVLATMQTIEWGWSGVYNWVQGYRKEFLPNELKYAPVFGKEGYIILVSGNCGGSLKAEIDQGTNQIFDDLVSIGYSASRIYYLNKDSNWRVDAMASSANLQWAITSWAATAIGVDPSEFLLLIMFDHGGDDLFYVNNPANPSDTVSASSLASWLNTLETATGASTYVVYTACHSGSFIDELSKSGRVIITSCRETETSSVSVAPYNEYFQEAFWPRIEMGLSLLDAFNPASQYTVTSAGYHPLLDDNGDGVGHGWDTPAGSGFLPHDGDGSLAANVYLTSSIWVYPQIDSVVATQFYAWPPPAAVNLWAEVENNTPLLGVTAWMLPPDWSPPPPGNVLVQIPLEPFNMTELGESGKWTVNIPADAFVAHATGPSNFRFMITAEEANSSAIPFWTAVEFTSTGLPPPDTTAPQVDILRPKDMQHVDGTIIINGTATDDVCLQGVELYVNSSLTEVVNVPPESSCFFQFAYTPPDPLSPTEFTVKAVDTSGNIGAQTVGVNTIRDVAVTDLTPYKTEVGQGNSLPINVTVANEGQLTEAFKVIVYANETLIQTRTVTLESGASTTLTFEWNTTGSAEGNYLIKAVASYLPYEINVANNEIDSIVQVVPQYNIIFDQTGVSPDFTGTVVTIDGTDYNVSALPASFWWDNSSIHSFAFQSPLVVGSGAKQYDWASTTGLSTLQSDSITVTDAGSVTGNYVTRVHDVAVTNIVAVVPHCSSKVGNGLWVFQGLPVYVNFTVLNKGDFDENVTVTLYYNMTANQIIGAQNVTLSPGQNETVAFVWDTTDVPYCQNYTITAVATIPLDNNPADNTLSIGPITVRIMGDINGDGKVDGKDIATAAKAFGTIPGDPRWNLDCDINGDGKVDGKDIVLVARNFGK